MRNEKWKIKSFAIYYSPFTFLMRLDLFLKASRLCERRSVAQKLCDAGIVFLNDKSAKSAHAVKPGDEITIRRGEKLTKVRVLALPGGRQTSRKESSALYDLLSKDL